jgi:TolB protein
VLYVVVIEVQMSPLLLKGAFSCNVVSTCPVTQENPVTMQRLALILLVVVVACRKDHNPPIRLDATTEIVFVSRPTSSGDWKLELMQGDGGNRRVIADINNSPEDFAISHDGKKIAWTARENGAHRLYVTDKAGGTPVLLASGVNYCGQPTWSPDDRKVVFMKSDVPAELAIYVVDVDGQHEQRLTPGNRSTCPGWFPDGKKIAYVSIESNNRSIYTMQADGSDRKLLSSANNFFTTLSVSPTGDKICLTTSGWEMATNIWMMNVDGSNLKNLIAGPDHFTENDEMWGESNGNPVWSPDGKKIAYVSSVTSRSEIYVINSDGTNDRRLTNTGKFNSSPSWSKDGQYILFASNRNGDATSDIYVMKANGQSQTAITKDAGFNILPVFVTP